MTYTIGDNTSPGLPGALHVGNSSGWGSSCAVRNDVMFIEVCVCRRCRSLRVGHSRKAYSC